MKRKYFILCSLMILIVSLSLILSGPVIKRIADNWLYEDWEQEAINIVNDSKGIEVFIDIIDNKVYVIKGSKVLKEYPCALGKTSTPSPVGKWKIVSKDTWGEGFGGRWMGFNVPWGKYGIHGTIYPGTIGSAASKGCIRMKNNDAAELYKIVRYGTPVTVYGGIYGPFGRGFRSLKPGDIGSDVLEVQKRLKNLGYYNGTLDGKYGTTLENAVYKFQKDKKIKKSKVININMYSALGVILFE